MAIEQHKVSWVLDVDIRGFFDAMDHEWLMQFIEHRITDKRVQRHIKKWLNAGVLADGTLRETDEGVPQGGVFHLCSSTSTCTTCWTSGSTSGGSGMRAAKSSSCATPTTSSSDSSIAATLRRSRMLFVTG